VHGVNNIKQAKKLCFIINLLVSQPNAIDFRLPLGIPQDLNRKMLIKCGGSDPWRNCNFSVLAGTKIVPSRSLPMNAVLPCSVDRQCATKPEAAPRVKSWQQLRAMGSAGASQPFDLDRTIFVPPTVVTLCGCGTWCVTLTLEWRPRLLGRRMLRKILAPKREKITRG
jgi:hypothetical protein